MEKISGQSLDIVKDNVHKLKNIFPEVFNEDKVDLEKLSEILGEYRDNGIERYNFTWPGKSKAIRIAQTPSTGTLRPCREESKNWDKTENLYIEGDNLEVLKLLQKSYYEKIKMIYIDPPYNTGNDFVYKDDFKDNMKNYLTITGQKDENGNKISTNTESSGRYHSNWLNMMYPRLKLARNLLKDDGVIFISIDDNEVDNLKKICDEIFGEENLITEFVWRRTDNQANIGMVAKVKEYILCYVKNKFSGFRFNKLPLSEKAIKEYSYQDKYGKFRRKNIIDKSRGKKIYKIKSPDGSTLNGPWMIEKKEFDVLNATGKIYWANERIPYGKKYLHESDGQIISDWLNKDFGTNQRGSKEIDLLFNKRVFDFTKPTLLIKTFISICTSNNEIVLDFFSGSSTTADAVIQDNLEKNSNNNFIMVQIQELITEKSEAYKSGYKNICEIGKERIRRAGEKIKEDNKDKEGIENLDIGFKVFKLDSSNINKWDSSYDQDLEQNLLSSIENIKKGRSEEDVLYEILLKYGIDLNIPIEEKIISGKKVFSIGFGALITCLDNEITLDVVEGIGKLKEELDPEICRVVFIDNGFKSDSLKTNAIQILKRYNIEDVKSI